MGLLRGEQQLRAFVMQMVITEMLPDDVVGLGGGGDFASGMWRTMLAERLALELGSVIDFDLVRTERSGQPQSAVAATARERDAEAEGKVS